MEESSFETTSPIMAFRILRLDDIVLVGDLNVVRYRLVLFLFRQKDRVRKLDPLHGAIGRDGDHIQAINLVEFAGFRHGGPCHAGKLLVEFEEILQRHRRQRLISSLICTPSLASTA